APEVPEFWRTTCAAPQREWRGAVRKAGTLGPLRAITLFQVHEAALISCGQTPTAPSDASREQLASAPTPSCFPHSKTGTLASVGAITLHGASPPEDPREEHVLHRNYGNRLSCYRPAASHGARSTSCCNGNEDGAYAG